MSKEKLSTIIKKVNKENERLLNENERLKKELEHTKKSLRVASDSYQSTFEEQLKSSIKLKKANHDLSQLKDHLLTLVNERTESLKKEMKLTEQVTENFNELAVVKADLENSKENLEKTVNGLIDKHKTNLKGVGQPLRIVLTGSRFGPGIYNIILSLNKDAVIKRLKN